MKAQGYFRLSSKLNTLFTEIFSIFWAWS